MATTLQNLSNADLLVEVQDAIASADAQRMADAVTEMQQRMQTDPAMVNALQQVQFVQPQPQVQSTTATAVHGIAGGLGTSKIVQKYRIEEPPLYDGTPSTLTNFKFQVETFCKMIKLYDPIRQQQLASSRLTGKALTWWRNACHSASKQQFAVDLVTTMKLDEFFLELSTAFRDVDHENRLLTKIMRVKQQGTVQQYIQLFRDLVVDLGDGAPADSQLLWLFIRGLKYKVQVFVRLQRPATLTQAQEIAESIDSVFYESTHDNVPGMPFVGKGGKGKNKGRALQYPSSYKGPMPMDLDFAKQMQPSQGGKNKGKMNNYQPQQYRRVQDPPSGAGKKKQPFYCYRCGKPGHYARDCRVRLNHVAQEAATSRPASNGPSSSKVDAEVTDRLDYIVKALEQVGISPKNC